MAKRMKNDPSAASGDGGLDLTPMIDVTFQLIIFFMCVTELSSRDREIVLPLAVKAEKDVVEPGRLTVDVRRDGDIMVTGQVQSDAKLRNVFKYEASISPKEDGLPNKAVYVRADREAPYRHVERVMALARMERLWRIMFSTKDSSARKSSGAAPPD